MQKALNQTYQKCCLFDGYYDGDTVKFSRGRYWWNSLIVTVIIVVYIQHLIVFITDDELLINELVYLRVAPGDFGSRYANFGKPLEFFGKKRNRTSILNRFNLVSGSGALLLGLLVIKYRGYSRNIESFRPLSFLFCFDEKEFKRRYHLSARRSKIQINSQKKLLRVAMFYYYNLGSALFFVTLKSAYQNILHSKFCGCVLLKIIGYSLYAPALLAVVYAGMIVFYEFVLCCEYLSNLLKDQTSLIFDLLSNEKYAGNKKVFEKKVLRIAFHYNLVTRNFCAFNRHFSDALNFMSTNLTLLAIYPAILIFSHSLEPVLVSILISLYISILLFISVIVYSNSKFSSYVSHSCFFPVSIT